MWKKMIWNRPKSDRATTTGAGINIVHRFINWLLGR